MLVTLRISQTLPTLPDSTEKPGRCVRVDFSLLAILPTFRNTLEVDTNNERRFRLL